MHETIDDTRVRVLVAEDETIIRADLRGLLEDNGFEVCGEARNGQEAVELARELEPDVAIVDIRMPELDGIEAVRRIYAERPIPIVMLIAHGDRRLVERALEAGAFAYLVKPFRETDVSPLCGPPDEATGAALAPGARSGRRPIRSRSVSVRRAATSGRCTSSGSPTASLAGAPGQAEEDAP